MIRSVDLLELRRTLRVERLLIECLLRLTDVVQEVDIALVERLRRLAKSAFIAYLEPMNQKARPVYDKNDRITRDGIRLHDPQDFAGMRRAGQVAAQILDDIGEHVFVGQRTGEIDRLIEAMVDEPAWRGDDDFGLSRKTGGFGPKGMSAVTAGCLIP